MPRKKKHETLEGSVTDTAAIVPVAENHEVDEVQNPYPDLNSWIPEREEIYFVFDGNVVRARFSDIIGETIDGLDTFLILKKHYKERMPDITQHINYFINFYDRDKEYFLAMMSMKYMIDKNKDLTQDQFKTLLLARIITDSFVQRVSDMARALYTININTDKEGKYKSTPKITNDHAKIILAVSFAIRLVLPLCIHFSNTNNTIVANRDYIKAFDKIFMGILSRFETINNIAIFIPICRFVEYRLDRNHNADAPIWD